MIILIMNPGLISKQIIRIGILLLLFCPVYAQEPTLMLPIGHSNAVNTSSYSPDGKYIVTASKDNTAKIWSAVDGKLLREFKGHADQILSARFSPNSKYIVTAAWDSTARIWNIADGKLVRTIKLNGYVCTAVFSPSCSEDKEGGQYVLTTCFDSPDGSVRIWNTTDGKMLPGMSFPGSVFTALYSPNRKYIVTASADSMVRCWSTISGKIIRTIKFPGSLLYNPGFSPACGDDPAGGKYIITACTDKTIKVWNFEDAKLVKEFGSVGSYAIHSPSYSPDGKYILALSGDYQANIWNTDGQLLKKFSPIEFYNTIHTANFSPDGKQIVAACLNGKAEVFNVADESLRMELKGHTDQLGSTAFSPNSKYMIIVSKTSWIWSLKEGKLLKRLGGSFFGLSSAVFSPACADDPEGGRYIATSSYDSSAKIWDAADGRQLLTVKGDTNMVFNVCFSPDGKNILTASADSTARIWDANNGNLIRVFRGHLGGVLYAVYSPDGKYIISNSYDTTARVWNVADGKLMYTLNGCSDIRSAVSFSPDGRQILMATTNNTARIFDVQTGKQVLELRGGTGLVRTAQYSPDGKSIITSSLDNVARVWDGTTGQLLQELRGHTNMVHAANYSADGKYIATNSYENITRIWDSKNGEQLYSIVALNDGNYLQMDKDGHYDGTEGARKLLYYTCGLEVIELEQFKDLSWEPGLVSKIMGINKEPITAKKLSEINICDYTPLVNENGFGNGVYRYEIFSRKGGVGEIQLFVNGKLVKKYTPSELPLKNNAYQLTVNQNEVNNYFVSGADNQVSVKATTSSGSMSSRGVGVTANGVKKSTGNPNMYIVAVGISNYKGEKLKLGYASKDAADFAGAVNASAEKLLNTDGRQHVSTYVFNTEPNNSHWPAKVSIQQTLDSIAQKATADDIFVLFFAGHGVLQSGQKNFYLLTAEASAFELNGVEKEVAISTEELNEWMRNIKASKQLLILDACNSGQAVKNLQELIVKRDVPADQQRALENLKDKTGTFILSASAAGQAAYETSLYGQGLLTYSLLSGLKLGDGLRENKYIDVTKWFNNAAGNVQIMAKDIGGRQDPQIIGTASFDVGLVDKDVVDGIRLSLKKKIFRRSKFIEDEDLLNDDLDLSALIDKELNNLSARGKESPLAFVADNTMTDAYSIRGKYEVKGNDITIKVSLFKGQKERVYQFDLSGISDKKEALAAKIVENVQSFMNR